jgi:YVTN family beta-propeller protein
MSTRALRAALAAACAAAQMCGARPAGAEVAYVADDLRDVVSVIDAGTQRISDAIPVGPGIRPCGIATTPDGRTLYAANPRPDSVSIVDLATFTTSSVFLKCPTDACDPSSVVVSPDGHFVYALSEEFDSEALPRLAVTEIDASAHAVTRTFEMRTNGVSSGCDIGAIAADGRLLYARVVVPEYSPKAPFALSVIDIASGIELTRVVSPPVTEFVAAPSGDTIVAVTPDGLAIIDAETQAIERMIPIGGELGAIALSPDGSVAYVVTPCEVVVVDLAGAAVKTIPLAPCDGGWPIVTRDGALLLIAQLRDPSIVEINTATNRVEKTVHLEQELGSLAVGFDRNTLYVANGVPGFGYANRPLSPGGLLELDLQSDAVTRLLRPAGPSAVAATPEGGQVYVASALSNEVAVIDARLKRVQAKIPVTAPSALAIDATSNRIFVGSSDESRGGVAAIDRLTSSIVNSAALDAPVSALAISPDGSRVYAATGSGYNAPTPASIVVFNAETLAPIATISADTSFRALIFAGDGRALYAAKWQHAFNEVTGGVAFIDPVGDRIQTIVDTDGGVLGLAISPDEQTIYAPSWYYLLGEEWSTLAVIDTVSETVRTSVPIERAGRIAITSAGDALYIASNEHVTVVDTETLETTSTIDAGVSLVDVAIAPDPSCIGDCDGNGVVVIAELVTMVNSALAGDDAIDSCPAMPEWCAMPGSHTISCLIGAVTSALSGCHG